MRKLIAFILLLSPSIVFAQQSRNEILSKLKKGGSLDEYRVLHPNACSFYKSADDYYSGSNVLFMDFIPNSQRLVAEVMTAEVSVNGHADRSDLNSFKDYWMSDEYGNLVRYYNNNWYTVLVSGPLTLYVKYQQGFADRDSTSEFTLWSAQGKFSEYYSLGLGGDVKKLDGQFFNDYLKKKGFLEAYENDNPKLKVVESPEQKMLSDVKKRIRYTMIMNEKDKK